MNKQEFLAAVKEKIKGMPQNDIDRSLDFYSEMIDDCIENGMSESEAVSSMGSADEVASQILSETGAADTDKTKKIKPQSKAPLGALAITLIILGFPVWGALLISAVAVIVSFYVVIWSVVISFFAVDISLAASSLCCIVVSVVLAFTGNTLRSILVLGTGIFLAGLSILFFLLSLGIGTAVCKLSKLIFVGIISIFRKKEVK